jgi:two-component system, cell cycle response regulator
MPKHRKVVPRNAAETVRVQSPLTPSPLEKRMATLLVVQGAEIDLGRHLLCDKAITIGRDEAAELALSDGSISRQHCQIRRSPENGQYMLVDLGSTNGTIVNGRRVDGRVFLNEGDKIFLGASALRFSFADSLDMAYHEKVEHLVKTDPLTGLTVRREYDAAYPAMIGRAERDREVVSLLVLDMDGLKSINDTHGHDVGCFALVEVSMIVRDILESHGLLCRFGGDEFVACLPGVTRNHALSLAEGIRSRVEQHAFRKNGIRVKPTMSIGVAEFPTDAQDAATLFACADKALYAAKRRGRNQVVGWEPSLRSPPPPTDPPGEPTD